MSAADLVNRLMLTRYRDGGRGPDHFDCWGLVVHVCREMGWPVPVDPLLVARSLAERRTGFAAHYEAADWAGCAGPADGVIGVTPGFDRALHAGICVGGVFLETSRKRGPAWTVFSKMRDGRWEWGQWARS